MKKGSWSTGEYIPVNKKKYMGKKNPIYRSSWEKRVFYWCDHNENVIKWLSETMSIEYFYEIDKKIHRYFPDVYAEIKTKDGKIEKFLFEVKPKKELSPPKKPKRMTEKSKKNYIYQFSSFIKNQCKWKAASQWCKNKNIQFKILTEDEIF
jgi:hypothetical protein